MSSIRPPIEEKPRTRAEWAEAQLRQAVVTGELGPGQRVPVEQLAQEWRLSTTPLREALRTLAGEGLIVLDAQRGARVTEISVDEMFDVYELRLVVEPYALRLSMSLGGDEWRGGVEAAWAALRAVQSRTPKTPYELEPEHTDFHRALVAACASEALLRLTSLLATQALRFRTLVSPQRPGGNKQSLAEHRRLYELVVEGRIDDATSFLAMHLSWPLAVGLDGEASGRAKSRLAHLRPDLVVEGLAKLGAGNPLEAAKALVEKR
jgi:GntR family carbon starvation induced transcriptional regulator